MPDERIQLLNVVEEGITMDEKIFYRYLFWYEVLLNVMILTVYDQGRAFFGVPAWIGVVLVLLIGVPAGLYLILIRKK